MHPTPTPPRRGRRTAALAVAALVASILVVAGGGGTNASATTTTAGPYLDAGSWHTCALTTSGDAHCWGRNSALQAPPEGVTGPFTAIAAGGGHTCALTAAGDARCWGDNFWGQAPPAGVAGPFTAITAGTVHTCALTASGAQCWGHNGFGQAPPAGVAGPFTAIAAGAFHTCALTDAGDAHCWGHSGFGQLTPPLVHDPFTAITADSNYTCALTDAGDAHCWGTNFSGAATPPLVHDPFTAIAAGGNHTCALTDAGDAQCWGYDGFGQAPPEGVAGPFTAIAAGDVHTCALTAAANAQCWGANTGNGGYGQAPPEGVAGPFGPLPTNTAPSVDAGGDVSGGEGSAISLDATVSDPDDDLVTTTWTYEAGVGVDAGAICNFDDADAVDTTITCTDDGTYTVTLTADDDTAEAVSDTATVTVNNVAPSVGAVTAPTDPVAVNTTVTVSAPFTDPGSNDTHTCSIDWGDESTPTDTTTSGTCSLTSSYPSAGVYTVALTVTDDDGNSDTGTFEYVVVYDAAAGFVTGGGWIDSPTGAYTPDDDTDADVTGKATFGFVSKYKKGAATPDGNTQFQFAAAGLSFASTSYDWLVISGPMAQYKGSGTINGTGDYGFLLTATDAQTNGGGDTDTFRLKIWHTATDHVVYDNQTATAIGGGSIVIHTAKK